MKYILGEKFRIEIETPENRETGEVEVRMSRVPEGIVIDFKDYDYFMRRLDTDGMDSAYTSEPLNQVTWKKGIYSFSSELGLTSETAVELTVRPENAQKAKAEKASGEETAAQDLTAGTSEDELVLAAVTAAGGIAKQILKKYEIEIMADILEIGGDNNAMDFEDILGAAKAKKNSVGGLIECGIMGLEAGKAGTAYWNGLGAELAKALMGLPDVRGFEFGAGFRSAELLGSEANDSFERNEEGKAVSRTNAQGGILKGRSNGMPVVFRVPVAPTYPCDGSLKAVNTETGELDRPEEYAVCMVPKMLPVIEGAAAIALLDSMMKAGKTEFEFGDEEENTSGTAETGKAAAEKKNAEAKAEEAKPTEIKAEVISIGSQKESEKKEKTMNENRVPFGLLGRKLGHSYSKEVHRRICDATELDYDYTYFEKEPEEIEEFLKSDCWAGLNVTVPYKQTVMPFLDEISEEAQEIGAVNTIVRKNGKIIGYNTDYYGFIQMLDSNNIDVAGKKCLMLGDGGAAKAVRAALRTLGASEIVTMCRKGPVTFDDIDLHKDAQVIINTTPVGMYPHTGQSLINVADFPKLEGVADVIYNPMRTLMLTQAAYKGINYASGLEMLTGQAVYASMLFNDYEIPEFRTLPGKISYDMEFDKKNIVIVGMPGVGKTTVGRGLAGKMGRIFIDMDKLIVQEDGRSIPDIFREDGEQYFRNLESEIIHGLGAECIEAANSGEKGAIIAMGGGAILREENYYSLAESCWVVFIERDVTKLSKEGRPVSQANDLTELYHKRLPFYRAWADVTVNTEGCTPKEAVEKVFEAIR